MYFYGMKDWPVFPAGFVLEKINIYPEAIYA